MNRKRTLSIISSSTGTAFGGLETYVINEARHLSGHFDINLVVGKGTMTDDFVSLPTFSDSISYRALPFISRSSSLGFIPAMIGLKERINCFDLEALTLLPFLGGLRRLLNASDIVEVHYPIESLIFPFLERRIKKIIHLHGPWLPPIYNRLRGRIDPHTDMLVTCSDWSRRELERIYGIPGVRVAYNGVDVDLFRPREQTGFEVPQTYRKDLARVGTVGRLGEAKGTDLLVEIAKGLQGVAEFFAVGPCDDGFLQRVKECGQPPNFHFLGPCPNSKLPEFYNFIDCFALPSLFENFPVTVLEAMSSGTPVVASNVGGLPEIVSDRIDGILVPPQNGTALKESILSFTTDGARRDAAGKAARETILRRFTHEKTYRKLSELYDEMLGEGSRSPK